MKKNKSSVSLKETFQLTLRACKIWWRENPKLLLSIMTFGVISALTPYVNIWLMARLVNEIAGKRELNTLTMLAMTLTVTTAVFTLLGEGLNHWKNVQLTSLWHTQNKIFMEKLLAMDFVDVDDTHTQELRSQIWQNTDSGGWGLYKIVYSFERIIKSVMSVIGAIAMTTSLFLLPVSPESGRLTVLNNPIFILLIVAIMFVVTLVSPMFSMKAGSYWVKYADEGKLGNRLFGFWLGSLGGDRTKDLDVRIYRQDILSRNNLKKYNPFVSTSKLARASRGPMAGYQALSRAVSQTFVGVAYIFVCLKALGGAFGVGSIAQYVGSITALSSSLSILIETIGDLKNNTSFLRVVFDFLDIPNKMHQGNLAIEIEHGKEYTIEFRNVSFRYPGQKNYALHNVSFAFKAEQRLAVVGRNGSGKTTFIKLLCRLYDPTEGEILLNGIDIRKYDYQTYMRLFSVVFQDFKLFPFELGENVASSTNYDKTKAVHCLYNAGFSARFSKLTKGLSTYLYKDFDENGVNVSGGEAQKIALARALYKDSPFIILDEPTAALDPLAEFEVYSKMNEIIEKKSVVFISHRLSSCRFCHDIVVFHEGKLIQQGSHNDLVNDKTGMYYQLWNAQAQYYKLEDSNKKL